MTVLMGIFLVSVAGIGAAFFVPSLSDLLLLAGPCAIASLYLLLRSYQRSKKVAQNWIVVDGSNVMYWNENTPNMDTLRTTMGQLAAHGFSPCVVFDANAGYLLTGKYEHDAALARMMGLPRSGVMVVSKGTPADTTILSAAKDLGARVLTNDRFRDWAEQFPEVGSPELFVRGGYRDGRLWLSLPKTAA